MTRRWTALAAAALALTPGTRAAAEVWPESGRTMVLGPEAMLSPGALGLVANPALLLGADRWSVGAAWLEPFQVPEFSRTDVAVAARLGPVGAGFGWSALGHGELGASATSVGVGAGLVPGRLVLGSSLRRAARSDASGWSADLGAWARPAREWRAGFAARGVWRGGTGALAPEAEWEAAVAWSPEPLAFGFSILRDAVGPIENRLGARLAMGPLETHLAYADRVGDEARVALGFSLTALGLRLGGAQESGRELPDSKGGFLETTSSRARPHAPAKRSARYEWGLTAGHAGGTASAGGTAPALGARMGGSVALRRQDAWIVELSAAASRDPGELAMVDERRAALRIVSPGKGELLLGSFDLRAGRGLVLAGVGGRATGVPSHAFLAESAGDWRRSPVPALAGAALRLEPLRGLRVHGAAGRTARDARPAGGALWPSGGRLHRTDLERARRGLLGESLWTVAVESDVSRASRLLLGAVGARHGEGAPRLAPGGEPLASGLWAFLAHDARSRTWQYSGEIARDHGGRWAASLHLRAATAARHPRARLEILAERIPPGFAAATGWPAPVRFRQLAARVELLPLGPAWSLVAGRRVDERWLAPTTTLPGRREWWREERLALQRTHAGHTATLEAGRSQARRATTGPSDPEGLWHPTRRRWLDAEWIWQPGPATRLRVAPAWSESTSGWRERWTLGVSRSGAWSWDLEAAVRPGTLVAEDWTLVEGDPLGGYRLAASTSPTRLRLRVRRGFMESELRWTEVSGRPRPEIWLTLSGAHRPAVW